jgi:hypothetical protein
MHNRVLLEKMITPDYLTRCAALFAAEPTEQLIAGLRKNAKRLRKAKERVFIGVPEVSALYYEEVARRLEVQ